MSKVRCPECKGTGAKPGTGIGDNLIPYEDCPFCQGIGEVPEEWTKEGVLVEVKNYPVTE